MNHNQLSFTAKREAELLDFLLSTPNNQEKKMRFTAHLNLGNIEIEFEAKDRDEAEKYLDNLFVSLSLDYIALNDEIIEAELIDDNIEALEQETSWKLDD